MKLDREKEEENALVFRAARGDAQAISALVERYSAPLYRFIQRTRPFRHDWDDILQETWVSVWNHLPRFDQRGRFSTWLFQIALNHCRDQARRDRVRDRFRTEAARRPPPTEDTAGPEERTEARRVLEAVESLPDRSKEVLLLRYYQGFSERETAEILDCPPGTVKSRLHQAVRDIRRRLNR